MYFNDRSNSAQGNDDGYVKLGDAIILQAVRDYRLALKGLASASNSNSAKSAKREVERFFHSGLFGTITNLEPDMLIAKLNEEVKSL